MKVSFFYFFKLVISTFSDNFIFDFYEPDEAGIVQYLFTDQQRQVHHPVHQNGHANGHDNGHPLNVYTQDITLYGTGEIKQEYSVKWENHQNGEKIDKLCTHKARGQLSQSIGAAFEVTI
ncbi:hypothetical protein ACQ4LE_008747 [Meloidogyne hapla]